MSQYKELPQVEFAVAAQNAFKKFFQFNGRIRRSEYWWGFLTLFIAALKEEREYDEVIFTSPDGEQFNQKIANDLSLGGNFIILAGHYKGVDQRVRDHLITREISVGDFVLTGGELPAAIIADAVVRLVPGVISDEQSALSDCFMDDMLSAPIYTRPRSYNGWDVPEILLSGNEAKIRQWEFDQAMERTKRLRPDLLKE